MVKMSRTFDPIYLDDKMESEADNIPISDTLTANVLSLPCRHVAPEISTSLADTNIFNPIDKMDILIDRESYRKEAKVVKHFPRYN